MLKLHLITTEKECLYKADKLLFSEILALSQEFCEKDQRFCSLFVFVFRGFRRTVVRMPAVLLVLCIHHSKLLDIIQNWFGEQCPLLRTGCSF